MSVTQAHESRNERLSTLRFILLVAIAIVLKEYFPFWGWIGMGATALGFGAWPFLTMLREATSTEAGKSTSSNWAIPLLVFLASALFCTYCFWTAFQSTGQ